MLLRVYYRVSDRDFGREWDRDAHAECGDEVSVHNTYYIVTVTREILNLRTLNRVLELI